MRFSELIERISGRVSGGDLRAGGDPEILGICEDSRKVRAGDLFVARAGTKADGGRFVADAIAKGAVAVVVERGQGSGVRGQSGDVASAEVGDVNLALALLAHEVGGRPTAGMKVIGVTGTKGKTTVAYLMRSVLKGAGKKVGMIGTVEIDDGETVVPAEMTTPGVVELVELFSRMKTNGVEYVVMEVSSHSLHQHRVGGIDFAVGIFTNLTGDHLDYHGTMEEYAAAKGMLFAGLRPDAVAVVNADDKWVDVVTQNCKARIVRYSVGKSVPAGGWAAEIRRMDSMGMRVIFKSMCFWKNVTVHEADTAPVAGAEYSRTHGNQMGIFSANTRLVGRHNVYNLLAALIGSDALLGSEHPPGFLANILAESGSAPGRLEAVGLDEETMKNVPFRVFVDYAHTHDALENVLATLKAVMMNESEAAASGKLICVFGCGGDRDRTKRPKMGAVAERLADRVIVTSDNPRTEDAGGIIEEICAGFSAGWKSGGKISVEADRRGAIRMAIEIAEAGDVVLIAGKGHENYQIIGTTKLHFDDVEEAQAALAERYEVRKQQ